MQLSETLKVAANIAARAEAKGEAITAADAIARAERAAQHLTEIQNLLADRQAA